MNITTATSPLKPLRTTALSLSNKTPPIHLRRSTIYRKRRRFKKLVTVNSNLNYHSLFNDLFSQFPSPTSIDLLAPALGLFSGLALFFSRFNQNKPSSTSCVGNWILFTSPTPFTRFVVLRCPSISFRDGDLLENVNEKLVKEDRHFVRLDGGRVLVNSDQTESESERNFEYQRRCISTKDSGVISLDWPANLVLEEEHGLDTTLLLVPGTAEGSSEKNIRSFVCEALKHGLFPVVMNPRGCGGSPLTSAR